uniref:Uncharacterized protein n=1 Tax=Arundo donax TaxID=35708 RepID=A0A0A9CN65_ARUDO
MTFLCVWLATMSMFNDHKQDNIRHMHH